MVARETVLSSERGSAQKFLLASYFTNTSNIKFFQRQAAVTSFLFLFRWLLDRAGG